MPEVRFIHLKSGGYEHTRKLTDEELSHICRRTRKHWKDRWCTEDAIACWLNECARTRAGASGFHNRGN
jgi:hypothetical protein